MRTRSTIIGYTVLTLLLTAGAAHSLSGSNTVFSDDIVDGAVTTADIKTNAISGSRILDNAVTGADVNESTLSHPLAVARIGPSPWPSPNMNVGVVNVTLPRPSHIVVLATATSMTATCAPGTNCDTARVGVYIDDQPVNGSATPFGLILNGSTGTLTAPKILGVTDLLPAGNHEVKVAVKTGMGTINDVTATAFRLVAFG